MVQNFVRSSLILALASLASAQFGGPPNGNYDGGNPYSDGGDGGDDGGRPDFANGYFGVPGNINTMVTAHAILGTLVFGLLFPSGSILIRLGSFRGLWLVHGIIQLVTYILFIAAAAIGIWMATHIRMMSHAHPVIGILLLVLIFFQPFLGFIHHFAFKKHSKRVIWSYAHIWLGRFVITLGIINGGLGLQLSKRIGLFAPSQGAIIGYSVGVGIIWLLYVAAAIYGERKRRNAAALHRDPPAYKQEGGRDSDVRYA
ncbi:uncharacterized protein LTR77_000222 [Saxophila tyrrhenica]|uniref:Cytochrome b561 domain-containing protein n=1 Tax=Saxophila tyrrhenica TaxID=1690608 RepID=A0AAV9PRW6_9PEZI|nr:hypothetical protein LTR77_000222 [Saxophila tyrrhenica]